MKSELLIQPDDLVSKLASFIKDNHSTWDTIRWTKGVKQCLSERYRDHGARVLCTDSERGLRSLCSISVLSMENKWNWS